jgi:photosystem II stability/assembly factor-like uncharacterized protein
MFIWKSILLLACCSSLFLSNCRPRTESTIPDTSLSFRDSVALAPADTVPRHAVYTSADYGLSWQPFSDGLPDQLEATCLTHIGPELVLATENGGLFMTTDHRKTWKDISNGLATKNINTLYVSGDEIYIGLHGEGITMWKLKSPYWNSFNNNLSNHNVLAIVKLKEELVIGTEMGIFKSSGHIGTWTGKYIGEPISSLAVKGDTLFAGTVSGILRSRDGGESWKNIYKGGAVHTLRIIGNRLYVLYEKGDLITSDNFGYTWTTLPYAPNPHATLFSLIETDDNYLMSNPGGIFRSKNGGQDWTLIYPDQHEWFADLTAVDHLVFGATRGKK